MDVACTCLRPVHVCACGGRGAAGTRGISFGTLPINHCRGAATSAHQRTHMQFFLRSRIWFDLTLSKRIIIPFYADGLDDYFRNVFEAWRPKVEISKHLSDLAGKHWLRSLRFCLITVCLDGASTFSVQEICLWSARRSFFSGQTRRIIDSHQQLNHIVAVGFKQP